MMKIALIDDALSIFSYNIFSKSIVSCYKVDKSLKVKKSQRRFAKLSHSDVCFKIIDYFIENKYELINIDISEKNSNKSDVKKLIAALKWCLNNSIDLINLSIGSTNFNDFGIIEEYINRLTDVNTMIFASHSNENHLTLPASSKNILGVRCIESKNLMSGQYYITEGLYNTEVVVSAELNELFPKIKGVYLDGFNSYATAYATYLGFLALKNGCRDLQEVICFLCSSAKRKMNYKEHPIVSKNKFYNVSQIPVIGYDLTESGSAIFEIRAIKKFKNLGYRICCITDNKYEDRHRYEFLNETSIENKQLDSIIEYMLLDILFVNMKIISDYDDIIDLLITSDEFYKFNDTTEILKINEPIDNKNLEYVLESIIETFC